MHQKRNYLTLQIRKEHHQDYMSNVRSQIQQSLQFKSYIHKLQYSLLCISINIFSSNIIQIIQKNPQLQQQVLLWVCDYRFQLQQLMIIEKQQNKFLEYYSYLELIKIIISSPILNEKQKQDFIHYHLFSYLYNEILDKFRINYKQINTYFLSIFKLCCQYVNRQIIIKLAISTSILLQLIQISQQNFHAMQFLCILLRILPNQLQNQLVKQRIYSILVYKVNMIQQQKNISIDSQFLENIIYMARHCHFQYDDLKTILFLLDHCNNKLSLLLISNIAYRQSWLQYYDIQKWIHQIFQSISLENYTIINVIIRMLNNLIINSNANKQITINIMELIRVDRLYLFTHRKLIVQFIYLFGLFLNCSFYQTTTLISIAKSIISDFYHQMDNLMKKKIILFLLLNDEIDLEECQAWINGQQMSQILEQLDQNQQFNQ